ncbi:hypothetical protein ACFFTK_16745 [Pseudonocardia petroleophila]|uniref:HD domain-containing protein n=1 Tax=Pseudonocardia petroleophila TaxID=37331 RepID=A0A7G7MD30_9PSEU|nr:hypothetical protein [Pseudonocardia petroleophila]QNG50691.1 hypothetical protein H6H00_21045 [Pseudonocardia petroleophila]
MPPPSAHDSAHDSAHETADELFAEHAAVFGDELATYRGHVHRVIGVVALQGPVPEDRARALGVAAFFHDAGIWFDGTWDYLPTSSSRAVGALTGADAGHSALVAALVDEHHRLRRARHPDPLVEAFRRADLADVTGGLVGAPGVPRARFRELVERYPDRGFRPMLARAFGRGLREAPWRPAPMLRF